MLNNNCTPDDSYITSSCPTPYVLSGSWSLPAPYGSAPYWVPSLPCTGPHVNEFHCTCSTTLHQELDGWDSPDVNPSHWCMALTSHVSDSMAEGRRRQRIRIRAWWHPVVPLDQGVELTPSLLHGAHMVTSSSSHGNCIHTQKGGMKCIKIGYRQTLAPLVPSGNSQTLPLVGYHG